MNAITPAQFVKKWSQIHLKERTTSQSHFLDICALVSHQPPLTADPKGEFFTFEADAEKPEGEQGWADAWYKNHFVWEYKGPHKNLASAYDQLLRYKDSLGNPPLLITSDTQDIIIHTNFTNTVKRTEVITFDRILRGNGVDLLHSAFFEPEKLRPAQTQEQVTRATAAEFVRVADQLRTYSIGKDLRPEQLAHFLVRLLFCLFAEDVHLLPNDVFTKLVHADLNATQFEQSLRALFAAMRTGGIFGVEPIPYFNGGLFDDEFVPPAIQGDVLGPLRRASEHDWASIDPSIFGTLFERIIDETKRAQLGAHYTSKDDILLVVEPVLMQPLRARWQELKFEVARLVKTWQPAPAFDQLAAFSAEIAALRVLDPACGSGNFLYIALRQLLDLQKEVITFASRYNLDLPLTVGPHQIFGIEINPYAHELAQMTVWIGYLQWRAENGFSAREEPILKPLRQIEHKDALLNPDGSEPAWPAVDVIVGNPPFLGGHKMRSELSWKYVGTLFDLYSGRVPGPADLVCYWFEKTRAMIETGQAKRAGLLATNSIRGGANRKILERIKADGDIFWAQSDRDWVLDGATVNVSMIGFDDGTEKSRILDDKPVLEINADLTASVNLTTAQWLSENKEISFRGTQKGGGFDIPAALAKNLLNDQTNTNGRPNTEVVVPWLNGQAIVGRPSNNTWIIDFGTDATEQDASGYTEPFKYAKGHVYPERQSNNRAHRKENWWLHSETAPGMRKAVQNLKRYIATPRISKYRLFVWVPSITLPDDGTYIFARDDDYFFGVLHSKIHEVWALKQGTSLEDRPRYTSTSTFETFPFPWPPGHEPQADPRLQAIAAAAKQLDDFRTAWLNPTDSLFHGAEKLLAKRTLTNLYNALTLYRAEFKGKQRQTSAWSASASGTIITLEEIETLDHIHTKLDHAVLAAYGWPTTLGDEQILERLLALNLERAGRTP